MIVAVVVSNLLYLGVAVVVAVVVAVGVVLRQRKPRSTEANVASFNRGLRALAPDDEDERPPTSPSWGGAHRPVLVKPLTPASGDDHEAAEDTEAAGDAPVELALRQRDDTGMGVDGAGPADEPASSEETGTG